MAKTAKKENGFMLRKCVQDLMVFTPALLATFKVGSFQRPITVNAKVHQLAAKLKATGGILEDSIIQLGVWMGFFYFIDGQHRGKAFLLSGLPEMLVKTTVTYYEDGPEGEKAMAQAYLDANRQIVRQKPDDMMRALECINPVVKQIKSACPFIGYDQVRRSDGSPVLSMSTTLRCWTASANEVPGGNSGSSMDNAENLSAADAKNLIQFLNIAFKAWGREPENHRLWAALNLTLCMWLYRRIVIGTYSQRSAKLDDDMFIKCLMGVSATALYIDWLVGRNTSERDRSPCYGRLREIFAKRIQLETGKKPAMPSPPWFHKKGT
jgi:hypothetical protein